MVFSVLRLFLASIFVHTCTETTPKIERGAGKTDTFKGLLNGARLIVERILKRLRKGAFEYGAQLS